MLLRIFILFMFLPFVVFSQKHINRYKHGERQGKWIVYSDSTKKQIDNCGRYRKGIPKATWKYYNAKGQLIKKEKIVFRKIRTIEYYPNGIVSKKGNAKMIVTDSLMHFFYYGDWLLYDSLGELSKIWTYKEGIKIGEKNLKTSSEAKVNDSLVAFILNLNKRLQTYNDSLLLAENKYGKNSSEYNRYQSLSNLNALKVLDEIDVIIKKYGYPGKSLMGKEYALVFSIISTTSLPYKEKYLNEITNAADKGELDWSDVAYFVDKVKVGKKEKQVYGTQFIIEDYKMLYYPIVDLMHLNERRNKVGLENLDLSQLNQMK